MQSNPYMYNPYNNIYNPHIIYINNRKQSYGSKIDLSFVITRLAYSKTSTNFKINPKVIEMPHILLT